MNISDKDIHKGHRSRMRSKLELYGARIFDTYELLEMLLYYVIPYKDTNPIAKRLLSEFGDLDGVLRAPVSALTEISGIGERCADLIARTGRIMFESYAMDFGCEVEIFDDYHQTGRFLTEYFKKSESSICIMLLDNGMRLIDVKDIPGDNFASGGVKAKYFIDAALGSGATVAVVAHKSRTMFPGEGEMATDKLIRTELAKVGVAVAENYMISGNNYTGIKVRLSIGVSQMIPGLERFYDSIPASSTDLGDYCISLSSATSFELPEANNPLAEILSVAMSREKASAAARSLLMKYGTLSTILSETVDEIAAVGEMSTSSALLVKLIGYLNSRRVTDKFEFGRVHSELEMREYMRAVFLGLAVETVYLILLDEKGCAISCDFICEGTVGASDIYPRKLIEISVKKKAKSAILLHNHPKGTPVPSKEDISATNRLYGIFNSAGIRLIGHYIVADSEIGGVELAAFM